MLNLFRPWKIGIALSHVDIIKSYIGTLFLDKSDFEAIENHRDDDYFKAPPDILPNGGASKRDPGIHVSGRATDPQPKPATANLPRAGNLIQGLLSLPQRSYNASIVALVFAFSIYSTSPKAARQRPLTSVNSSWRPFC
jgi:hypothetical protein